MKKKVVKISTNKNKTMMCGNGSCGGGIYGLGFLGSAVYFISTASSFGNGVLGFLKAIVWPAFLVHGLFKFIGA